VNSYEHNRVHLGSQSIGSWDSLEFTGFTVVHWFHWRSLGSLSFTGDSLVIHLESTGGSLEFTRFQWSSLGFADISLELASQC